MYWNSIIRFESSVNSEGIETKNAQDIINQQFESSVNSEGIETTMYAIRVSVKFESSVNSEGIETVGRSVLQTLCLRAV